MKIVWDKKKKIILGVIIGLGVLAIALGVWAYVRYKNQGTSETVPVTFTDENVVCKLEGTKVPADLAKRTPLAVMVENHPEARPQVGLDKASVVYEAIAEGGITRFMPIYSCHNAEEVGPVRSARVYFVDWAEEYNALYAHAGGAQNALTMIVEDGVLDLNHNSTAFWRRDNGKALEHTLYTTTEKLYQYAADEGYNLTDTSFTGLEYKTDAKEENRPESGSAVVIDFSSASYQVSWDYNKDGNDYSRNLAGEAHLDESGSQLIAKNIVIATYNRTAVESGGKTVYVFDTLGSGPATVLRDGKVVEGTWKKEKQGQRTLYYDSDGKEIEFNPGTTWIEAINPDSGSFTLQ